MKPAAIDVLLGLALVQVWLGCVGFARLRSALDRLHCVTFVNAGAGLAIVVTAFVSDGLSDRALKILLLAAVQLVVGAGLGHATARAVYLREPVRDRGE